MSDHDPARRPTATAERYERLLGAVTFARPDDGELMRFGLDAIAPAELPPDVGTDWAFQRVMVALRTSRPQEAEQWARHLIPARLDHQGLRFALARALEEQGRWAEAREVLQAFTHPASDARYQQGSARYHYLWADRREARRLYAVVLDRIRSVGDVDPQRLAGHELPDYAYVFLDWAAMCLLDGDPATAARQLDHDAATLRDGSFGRVDADPQHFVDGATFRFLRGVLAQAAGDMGVRLPRSRLAGIHEFGDFESVQDQALRERSADRARELLLQFRPSNRTNRVLVTAALAALGGRARDEGMERTNLARLRLRSPNLLEPHLAVQFRMLAAQERWLDPYRAHRSAHRPPPASLPPPATLTLPDAPPTATTEVPASLDHALRALARSHADASAISTVRQHAATMPFPLWEELTDAMTQRGAHALVHDLSVARLADAHPLELPVVAGRACAALLVRGDLAAAQSVIDAVAGRLVHPYEHQLLLGDVSTAAANLGLPGSGSLDPGIAPGGLAGRVRAAVAESTVASSPAAAADVLLSIHLGNGDKQAALAIDLACAALMVPAMGEPARHEVAHLLAQADAPLPGDEALRYGVLAQQQLLEQDWLPTT